MKPKNKDPKWLRPFRGHLEDALRFKEIEPETANAALDFIKSIGSRTAKHLWIYTHDLNGDSYDGKIIFEWSNSDRNLSFEFKDVGGREQILHMMRILTNDNSTYNLAYLEWKKGNNYWNDIDPDWEKTYERF